jgi:hypothetical protein
VLCADGPVRNLAGLSLAPEHWRGHGALYDAVSHGRISIHAAVADAGRAAVTAGGRWSADAGGGCEQLAAARRGDQPGQIVLPCVWPGEGQAQMIPAWPYSVVAALEPGRTSWTAVLDAVRLGPDDEQIAVTGGRSAI